jgi:hypothetical protein
VTGMRDHSLGCTCRRHKLEPWDRSEHWTQKEVAHLEEQFGHVSDGVIARKLGRTVVGIRIKAKRLGLHKRTAAFTAAAVAEIFGVDGTTVGKGWVRRNTHAISLMIRAGELRGAKRGQYWYIPKADVAKIRPLRSLDAIEESWFRRESVLEVRRNRRKGVATAVRCVCGATSHALSSVGTLDECPALSGYRAIA